MKIHLLSGFLGSGKTTAIQHASRILMSQGTRTGVVTNDQGIKLVDGNFFKSLNIPNRKVVNGCFCCNYHELENNLQSLIKTTGAEVIFAESVGSCTDIVATVLKPLLQVHKDSQITLSTFADVRLLQMILNADGNSFDDTVNYIYLKQLEEAAIIVINKIDLIHKDQLTAIKKLMQEKYGDRILIYQNSLDEACVLRWLNTLNHFHSSAGLPSLNIDYDTYASGEAKLAWLDEELEIYSSSDKALDHTESLISSISQKIQSGQYPIGHLKFLINDEIKISFTSNDQSHVELGKDPAASATLLINIRVQTEPGTIKQLIKEAIREEEIKSRYKIIVTSQSAFQPGYPRPTYRV